MNEQTIERTDGGDHVLDSVPGAASIGNSNINVSNKALSQALVDIERPVEWVSFPVNDRATEMRVAAMRCYIGNDIKRMKTDDGWLVKDMYLTSQCYVAKDGEVIKGPVLHLINPDGKSIRIVAKYSILAILTFVKSWKPFPWNPPVRMKAVDRILDSDNRVYEIQFSE